MSFSPVEAFISLFIGMGPIKVLLVFIAMTKDLDPSVRRQMARRIAVTAGIVGVALFVIGATLQSILHFSIGALNIIGGIILLLLALRMVLGSDDGAHAGDAAVDPMTVAISPLAIPLTLNPVGIVTLVVASSQVQDIPSSLLIIIFIAVIVAINYGVLLLSDRVAPYLSTATVQLLEVVLGILLGALAVQLMLDGLAGLGIITMSTGGH